jgi:DnaJ family protein A protein 2
MPEKSLYDTLGVNKSDSCGDIKKAFLKLARLHHPDKGGDPEKFKEIHRASEILTNEEKRKVYDQYGVIPDENGGVNSSGPMPGGMPFPFEFNMNDLFGNMFGGQRGGPGGPVRKGKKAPPITQTIKISLEKFYKGYTIDLHINRQCFCGDCNNSGAKSKETCTGCNGRGVVTQIHQMGPMVMQTNGPCTQCQGKGEKIIEKCEKCSGSGFTTEKRDLNIKVVPGTRSGEMYVFNEVCSDHPQFEKAGDAHIIVVEDESDPAFKYFKRTGDKSQHLETNVTLSLAESLVGCVVQIDEHPGYDDGLFIQIPAGSFQGDKYCLRGFGMPVQGDIGKHGDLIVNINVIVKPIERKLFSTKGRELLSPLFEDKVRKTECTEEDIQKELFLSC